MNILRPPIVAVLGHVDHGKTTLLDSIRKTNLVSRESGGITQSIGASFIETTQKKGITFIDTPGHEAFNKMRSRGVEAADIVILVVAADDGVKPQTKEAITYIQKAKTPFFVAITKIDVSTANIESVKGQLEKEGVLLEGRGGDTPIVEVSAKTGKGVEDLLEMILLIAEVEEIKGDINANLEAVVIETQKGKMGLTVAAVVKSGSINVADEIAVEGIRTKVRGLFDWQGKPIKKVGPGEPVLILGFSQPPDVGTVIKNSTKDENLTKDLFLKKTKKVPEGNISVIIKTSSAGSLEAILAGIPEKFIAIASEVGDVSESDVFMAKSTNSNIYAFDVKVPAGVERLAETDKIKIEKFSIIYELFDRLKEQEQKDEKKILGRAEILAEFPYDSKKIAGVKILKGEIKKDDKLILTRLDEEISETSVKSLKKQKEDIEIAKEGEECGILFQPQLDFKIGDVLVSVANG